MRIFFCCCANKVCTCVSKACLQFQILYHIFVYSCWKRLLHVYVEIFGIFSLIRTNIKWYFHMCDECFTEESVKLWLHFKQNRIKYCISTEIRCVQSKLIFTTEYIFNNLMFMLWLDILLVMLCFHFIITENAFDRRAVDKCHSQLF